MKLKSLVNSKYKYKNKSKLKNQNKLTPGPVTSSWCTMHDDNEDFDSHHALDLFLFNSILYSQIAPPHIPTATFSFPELFWLSGLNFQSRSTFSLKMFLWSCDLLHRSKRDRLHAACTLLPSLLPRRKWFNQILPDFKDKSIKIQNMGSFWKLPLLLCCIFIHFWPPSSIFINFHSF